MSEKDKAMVVVDSNPQPVAKTAYARAVAKELMAIVKECGMAKNFGGAKDHLEYEAWQFIAAQMGCSVHIAKVTDLRDAENRWVGYTARAEVVRVDTGQVMGSGEAECTSFERNWRSRDSYALKSMAQTRAASKAIRMVFAWIARLGGYSGTPAEEMEGAENGGEKKPAAKPAPKTPQQQTGGKPVIRDPDAPATEKQINAVCGAWADPLGYPFGELKGYLTVEDKSGQLVGTITKQQASDLIGMSNQGDFDPARWRAMTNVLPNVPPPDEVVTDA